MDGFAHDWPTPTRTDVNALQMDLVAELHDGGFEPQTRARSNTWPCPRPENFVDPPDDVESTKASNQHLAGDSQQTVQNVNAAKKNSSRRNAWGNLSYADLITHAIGSATDKRLTLSQIYEWMVHNVPYFKDKGDSNSSAGWKNSIRHNLSLHNRFMRVQNEGTGKSSWWMLNPDAKQGKSVRRRAASMETSRYEKRRGRAKKRVEALRQAGVTTLNDNTPSPSSSISEGLDHFPESPLHSDHDSLEDFEDEKVLNVLHQPIEVLPPRDSPVCKKLNQKSYRHRLETSWSDGNTLKLIQEVESRRCLWDFECAEYKLRKDSVWQEVADAIPKSIIDCKVKWGSLRKMFNLNLEKLKKKKSCEGSDEALVITWKFFKPMMFLKNSKRKYTIFKQLVCVTTDESVCNDLEFIDELYSPSPSLSGQRQSSRSNTPVSLPSTSSRHNNDLQEIAIHSMQSQLHDSFTAQYNNDLREMTVEALQSAHSMQSQPNDSSTAFAEYIAAELRTLTPEQAAYARSKLRRAFNDIMDEVTLMVPQQL